MILRSLVPSMGVTSSIVMLVEKEEKVFPEGLLYLRF
jgi:hypothetical protein